MSEENNTNQDQQQQPAEDNQRDAPWAQSLKQQINEERKANAELSARLQKFEDEAKAREQADLEAKGEYQKVLEKIQGDLASATAERDALTQRYERELAEAQLRQKATKVLSMPDDLVLDGLSSQYFRLEEQPDMDEWLKEIKEEKKDLFGKSTPGPIPGTDGGAVAGRNSRDDGLNSSEDTFRYLKEAGVLR